MQRLHKEMADRFGNQPAEVMRAAEAHAEAHKVEKVDPSMQILESALTYARDKNLERRAVSDERELMRDALKRFDGGSKLLRDKRKIRKADSVR